MKTKTLLWPTEAPGQTIRVSMNLIPAQKCIVATEQIGTGWWKAMKNLKHSQEAHHCIPVYVFSLIPHFYNIVKKTHTECVEQRTGNEAVDDEIKIVYFRRILVFRKNSCM